jgi:hypothetical protein
MTVIIISLMTIILIAIIGVTTYLAVDYNKHKKQNVTDFEEEKDARLSNIKTVVGQVNTVNRHMTDSTNKQFKSMSDSTSKRFNTIETDFKNYKNTIDSVIKIKEGFQNAKEVAKPAAKPAPKPAPAPKKKSINMLAEVNADAGLNVNKVSAKNKFKVCGEKGKCISIPNDKGETYFTSVDPNNSILFDAPVKMTGNAEVDGDVVVKKKIFIGGSGTTPDGAKNSTDPYYLEKVSKGMNQSSLRLTINDDADESLEIWGDSCRTTGCNGAGVLRHKFGANGNAEHKGVLKVRHGHGGWTDNASITAQATDGQIGASFAGAQGWSHFPWVDQNTYIRPGKDGRNINIGDWGAANVNIGKGDTNVNVNGSLTAKHVFVGNHNVNHPDNRDGAIYRADGQLQIATDDLVRVRHTGSKQTGIQLDARPGAGDMHNPNGEMKITRQGIMFGGPNNNREVNSGQISAGRHIPNSLNIVGMSSGKGHQDRRVDMWAEGGFNVYGNVNANNNVFQRGDTVHNGGNNWIFHTPNDGRRTMYIAPSSAYNNQNWNWGNSLQLEPNGDVVIKGNLIMQHPNGQRWVLGMRDPNHFAINKWNEHGMLVRNDGHVWAGKAGSGFHGGGDPNWVKTWQHNQNMGRR